MKLALKHDLKPVIKPREVGYHGMFRKQTLREFKRNRKLYRQRGIVETVFAGLANKYGSRTRFRRLRTKVLGMLLMLVAHNLRTYMRVRAGMKWGYFLFAGFFRQTGSSPVPPSRKAFESLKSSHLMVLRTVKSSNLRLLRFDGHSAAVNSARYILPKLFYVSVCNNGA